LTRGPEEMIVMAVERPAAALAALLHRPSGRKRFE
jgi:hypothetical protein